MKYDVINRIRGEDWPSIQLHSRYWLYQVYRLVRKLPLWCILTKNAGTMARQSFLISQAWSVRLQLSCFFSLLNMLHYLCWSALVKFLQGSKKSNETPFLWCLHPDQSYLNGMVHHWRGSEHWGKGSQLWRECCYSSRLFSEIYLQNAFPHYALYLEQYIDSYLQDLIDSRKLEGESFLSCPINLVLWLHSGGVMFEGLSPLGHSRLIE